MDIKSDLHLHTTFSDGEFTPGRQSAGQKPWVSGR